MVKPPPPTVTRQQLTATLRRTCTTLTTAEDRLGTGNMFLSSARDRLTALGDAPTADAAAQALLSAATDLDALTPALKRHPHVQDAVQALVAAHRLTAAHLSRGLRE
ncbi:hypothetical protein [Deinococcus kurensis]|uniref:hypothetical protein n=1 Tax=Deinococcus kurensis TaxID=2662757 RepID=UPI0012D2CEC6|nr:hypothetical protein [Deinococcus kurensis]